MKKLKCLLLYLILSFSIGTEVYAQVSKQDAIDLVFDSIVMNRVDSVNVYMEPAVLTDAYYVVSPYDSIEAPYSNYWLAFIDDFPMLYWEHSCTYVFINQINDNFTKVNYFLPPINYQIEMDSLSVPFF